MFAASRSDSKRGFDLYTKGDVVKEHHFFEE